MKEPHDMSDRELDVVIADAVMGQTVAAEEWPCWLYEDGTEILPQHDVVLSRVFSYEPVLYRMDPDGRGTLVICPAYTTDARETEKVMARMSERYYASLTSKPYELGWEAQFDRISVCPYHEFTGRMTIFTGWKRAVCEAALLAVRSAAL